MSRGEKLAAEAVAVVVVVVDSRKLAEATGPNYPRAAEDSNGYCLAGDESGELLAAAVVGALMARCWPLCFVLPLLLLLLLELDI